eukprot:1137170-Pelagomonas_calceolata.AAC.4
MSQHSKGSSDPGSAKPGGHKNTQSLKCKLYSHDRAVGPLTLVLSPDVLPESICLCFSASRVAMGVDGHLLCGDLSFQPVPSNPPGLLLLLALCVGWGWIQFDEVLPILSRLIFCMSVSETHLATSVWLATQASLNAAGGDPCCARPAARQLGPRSGARGSGMNWTGWLRPEEAAAQKRPRHRCVLVCGRDRSVLGRKEKCASRCLRPEETAAQLHLDDSVFKTRSIMHASFPQPPVASQPTRAVFPISTNIEKMGYRGPSTVLMP